MQPASPPQLSTVVVTHDSGAVLERCLRSIQREAEASGLDCELIVVDNASSDRSVDRVEAQMDGLTILRNPTNRGFGDAANQGFRAARSDRVLLLNPDAELCAGSLQPLLDELEAHPEAGVVAPALLLPDGRLQRSARRFYRWTSVLARRTPVSRLPLGRRALDRHFMEGLDLDSSTEVDWVTGAAMMLRRQAVPESGPFDERYFLYFEDVDLCRRLGASGRTVRFQPSARVRHRFGRGSRRQVPWNPLLWHHLLSGAQYSLRWSLGWWQSRWWRTSAANLCTLGARLAVLGVLAGQLLHWAAPALALGAAGAIALPISVRGRISRPPVTPLPQAVLRLSIAATLVATLLAAPISWKLLPSIVLWGVAGATSLRLARWALAASVRWGRARGFGHRSTIVAGSAEAASLLARSLTEGIDEGMKILGFSPIDPLSQGGPSPRLPDWEHIVSCASDLRADSVLLAGSAEELAQMAGQVADLRQAGVEVAFAYTGATELLQGDHLHQLAGHPLLPLGAGAETPVASTLMSLVERSLAILGLVLLTPLAPLLLSLATLASGRRPLHAATRLGKGLKPFSMWRLRSGPGPSADQEGGRVGTFLRATHLDELPQLWNVARGEMSLVGPRPVSSELAEGLSSWQKARFKVRPGITGMWQLDRLRRWRLEQMIASDLLYLLRWSPSLDLRILVETFLGRRTP